jgi:hypothetical protein
VDGLKSAPGLGGWGHAEVTVVAFESIGSFLFSESSGLAFGDLVEGIGEEVDGTCEGFDAVVVFEGFSFAGDVDELVHKFLVLCNLGVYNESVHVEDRFEGVDDSDFLLTAGAEGEDSGGPAGGELLVLGVWW